MQSYLDFEKPVAELEGKIQELRHISGSGELNIAEEVSRLQGKVEKLLTQTYGKLTPWQKTQVARHPGRPHFLQYAEQLMDEFEPLSGDRNFAEDAAIIGGIRRVRGQSILLMGHEKGADTESRLKHNFGMARPEGYRKADRLMRLAERFHLPVVTLVDTSGAYPGIDAEARGQSEAIARSIETCLDLATPLVSIVIGEGGSGGAIALAVANRVFMLEHAVYSVISPEGCASILWREGSRAPDAAAAMRITADDLFRLGVIDKVIGEPLGGAHRNPEAAITTVGDQIERSLTELSGQSGDELRAGRRKKFLEMGRSGLN